MASSIGPRRTFALVGAVLLVLAVFVLANTTTARAATDHYCTGCKIYNNSYIIDPHYYWLTGSYVHYLGSGDRYMGAGAWGYANFIWDWNTAYHGYGGGTSTRAAAGYSGSNTYATSNAHANY